MSATNRQRIKRTIDTTYLPDSLTGYGIHVANEEGLTSSLMLALGVLMGPLGAARQGCDRATVLALVGQAREQFDRYMFLAQNDLSEQSSPTPETSSPLSKSGAELQPVKPHRVLAVDEPL